MIFDSPKEHAKEGVKLTCQSLFFCEDIQRVSKNQLILSHSPNRDASFNQ